MKNGNQPYIITIGGGSGSGKTTFARRLREGLGADICQVLYQDSYYIDQSNEFDHDGGNVNFDHPDALDFILMASHINQLKRKQEIEVPFYDFATHTRITETTTTSPKPIIIVDGILVLSQEKIRNESDLLIFIDCEENLRYERRLKRDVEERGRTPEGVKTQFQNQVKPMHDQFVEPAKKYVDALVTVENFDQQLSNLLLQIKNSIN